MSMPLKLALSPSGVRLAEQLLVCRATLARVIVNRCLGLALAHR
jgi:hypothetical protein